MGDQTDSSPAGSARPTPAVVYFAKAPVPGRVKTRLVPPLTEREAAALYGAFLQEIVVPIAGARTLLYGWPPDHLAALRAFAPAGVELRPQRGADLWQRMTHCMDELLASGHRPVLIRNTDSPDLPVERVAEALARSAEGTVVLGPDDGGGYYLVALSAPCPSLFEGLDEGSGTVFEHTVERAGALGLKVEVLHREPDVDTFDDLVRLWRGRLPGRR